MTLDRVWLLGTARAEREALGRTIQYTPPDRWEAPSVSAGWRNRDIVAHMAADDVAAASILAGEVPAEFEEYQKTLEGEPFTLDGLNDWTVQRRANEPFRTVAVEWGRAADLFLTRAAKITPEEWATRKVTWVAGGIGVSYLVQSRVMEWWLHGQDIGAGADLPPRIEHPPIFCVNDLAVRMIPYALGLAGLSYPGKSVKVELTAAGGGTWHYGLAAREAPPEDKEPDVVIEGRGYPFALVAGRRVPAEYYRADGTILIGGDVALGETILEHLRAFAA
ncbi:MAG TPA: maleylpyruvate isomerase family mycothiol-dependent enzyme [Actinomycetota bacterium]|nr:maleylpyruvate isomerase family mycothiol-dependent enzyme [Actinomycetota bacterium]